MILHDYIEQTDGGSRLCLELARGLNTSLLCGFVRSKHPFLQDNDLIDTLYSSLPIPLIRQYMLAQAFKHKTGAYLKNKSYAIYSGSYAPLAIHNALNCKNILYCHTPPRFLYDQEDTFMQMAPKPLRFLLKSFCSWLKPQYEQAVQKMDIIIANSKAVQERINKYLYLQSIVINPPCDIDKYYYKPSQGYFLSMVRLDSLKRVHLLIEAFKTLPNAKLIVTSSGAEENSLKSLAKDAPNITFTGMLSEEKRLELLANCLATICIAKSEDFGMCAVESLASGKPVIIAKDGGLQEIIEHEETGLCLSANPTVHEIKTNIINMDIKINKEAASMRLACQEHARQYDAQKFIKKIKNIIG